MTGKIQIWNMALGFVGTRTVASENENCAEAVQCALYWNAARRQALRDFPYNFAQRRAFLAETDLPEEYACDWAHAYALPADCLKAHGLRPLTRGGGSPAEAQPLPFALGAAGKGEKLLFCNVSPALLAYTADVDDAGLFDDLFAGMLARKLACMIAAPLLKNNSSRVHELSQMYAAALPDAMRADASERKCIPPADSWLTARQEFA